MRVAFTPAFLRQVKKLNPALQEEVVEKAELFINEKNHKMLKAHKLKGPLSGLHSFSVNYKTRIVFEYTGKEEALFHAIGDHDIYK